jgi:hypothetical protein
MKPDIMLDGISVTSLGWLRESVNFPTPQSQSETITVPGRNAPIRYTEALGRVSYQPRSFDITLSMLGSRSKYNEMVGEVVNRFAGQLVQVICSEEPNLYCYGTLEAAPTYDPLTGKGQLVLSSTDGDAYRYHLEETVVIITGSGIVTLENDYMPVVPTVTTTAETALAWKVGMDSFQKSVSAGIWEFPELELQHGSNFVNVTGTGDTTFRYREGRL